MTEFKKGEVRFLELKCLVLGVFEAFISRSQTWNNIVYHEKYLK